MVPQKLTFSPLSRRQIEADFSGGHITSDAGVLLLREVDKQHRLTQRLAETLTDQALNWWQAFDDAELNQLVERALEQNRTLAQARANVDRAYAVFRDADNDSWPKGTLETGYQASENNTLSADDDDVITRGYSSGANLSWDLDLFGKLRRASEAAEAQAQQADILWRDAQVRLISQVATSYGEYRGAQLRLEVAEENLENLQQSRAIVLARLEVGMASELGYTDLMVDGAPSPHQSDTTLRWLIDRLRS